MKFYGFLPGPYIYKFTKAIQNGNFDSIFRNVMASYLGTGMTDAQKEQLDYEDKLADENAEDAYRRQQQFQEDYLSPAAQLRSLAEGYQSVGINKMALVGSQPGASSSTAPMASPSGGAAPPIKDILGSLLGFAELKQRKQLQNRELDIKEEYNSQLGKLAEAQTKLAEANTTGQNITNTNLDEWYKAQIKVTKDQLNNNVVQRRLWNSGITANEARAALDRANAWLSGIQSRIVSSDANYQDKFNYLQYQYMYWSVESQKVQGQFARRMALKQLEYVSSQISLMGEQIVGTKVGYLKGFEEWKQAQFVTGKQGVTYWKDFATDILKTAGIAIGSVAGLSKVIGGVGQAASPLFTPKYGPTNMTGMLPQTPGEFWRPGMP